MGSKVLKNETDEGRRWYLARDLVIVEDLINERLQFAEPVSHDELLIVIERLRHNCVAAEEDLPLRSAGDLVGRQG